EGAAPADGEDEGRCPAAARIEGRRLAPYLDECLLHDLLRLGPRVEDAEGERQRRRRVSIVERAQGAGVSCGDAAQERLVDLRATHDAEQRGEEHGLRAISRPAQGCNPGRHAKGTELGRRWIRATTTGRWPRPSSRPPAAP